MKDGFAKTVPQIFQPMPIFHFQVSHVIGNAIFLISSRQPQKHVFHVLQWNPYVSEESTFHRHATQTLTADFQTTSALRVTPSHLPKHTLPSTTTRCLQTTATAACANGAVLLSTFEGISIPWCARDAHSHGNPSSCREQAWMHHPCSQHRSSARFNAMMASTLESTQQPWQLTWISPVQSVEGPR